MRFGATLLVSRAIAGTFDTKLLDNREAEDITTREALTAFGTTEDAELSACIFQRFIEHFKPAVATERP